MHAFWLANREGFIAAHHAETVSHSALRRRADRLNTALYMIELVAALLAEADPHPEVFELLHNALGRLGAPEAPAPAVLAYFQWRLLRNVGLMGELDTCVACGRAIAQAAGHARRGVCFSAHEGGLLCADCEAPEAGKRRVSPSGLAGLAALAAVAAGKKVSLPPSQAQEVNRLLAYYVTYHLGKPLKMARHAIG